MYEHADRDHSEPTLLDPDVGEMGGARAEIPLQGKPATRDAEQDVPTPGTWPTPQQLLNRLDSLGPEERLEWAARAIHAQQVAGICFVMDHEGRLGHLERALGAAQGLILEARAEGGVLRG